MEIWEVGPEATANLAGSSVQRLAGDLAGRPTPGDGRIAGRVLTLAIELAHRAPVLHDISDGGLAVALAEICIASGVGAEVEVEHPFSEDPHRFLAVADRGTLGLPGDIARVVGVIGGPTVTVNGHAVPLEQCSDHWHNALGRALAG
ncbi:MAG TPA: AIR synthase-related protein, partial [Acidimicrobiia bacterium]|nr:AIR synthase-related protein [Acidimicrobiia bacterium]